MIRDLSQLSFSGTVTLHSGENRVELVGREGRLEIHVPRGQNILKLLALRKKIPSRGTLPFPSFVRGTIPVFVFGRPLLHLKINVKKEKTVSWAVTPLDFLKKS